MNNKCSVFSVHFRLPTLSIAACILNVQSPCCYSQCKYIGCSVEFEMLQTKAVGFSEILVDSNRSTPSHMPEDWHMYQQCCGNPQSRVHRVFALRWQWLLAMCQLS